MDEWIKWQHLLFAFVHDIAIAVYIGGAISMELVLGPAQNSIPPAQAQVMGQKSADRFLWLVWGSLGFIIVSGIARVWRMNMLEGSWPFVADIMKLDVSYGRTIWAMFGIWILLVINGLIITFVLRPRLSGKMSAGVSAQRAAADRDIRMRAAHQVEILTRVDIGLALLAALLGASLKLGGVL